MKNLFDLKRTKMIDEPAFRHKPTTTGKNILSFILVFFVSSIISGLIPGIIDVIYNFTRISRNGLLDAYSSAVQEGNTEAAELALEALFESVESPWWLIVVSLFATVLVAASAIFYCIKFEKRNISSMGIRKKGAVLEALVGISIGAVICALVVGLSYLTTSVSFVYDKPFTTVFFILIPACLVSAFADEVLLRGYLMTSLARDMKPIAAILISALVYSAFQIISLNPIAIINTFLFGILMGVYVFKRGSIWGAVGLNFAWTYISNVIFGSPALSCPSILEPVFKHLGFISGEEFGFDAGLSFTLIIAVAIVILLLTKTKKSEISEFEIDYFA